MPPWKIRVAENGADSITLVGCRFYHVCSLARWDLVAWNFKSQTRSPVRTFWARGAYAPTVEVLAGRIVTMSESGTQVVVRNTSTLEIESTLDMNLPDFEFVELIGHSRNHRFVALINRSFDGTSVPGLYVFDVLTGAKRDFRGNESGARDHHRAMPSYVVEVSEGAAVRNSVRPCEFEDGLLCPVGPEHAGIVDFYAHSQDVVRFSANRWQTSPFAISPDECQFISMDGNSLAAFDTRTATKNIDFGKLDTPPDKVEFINDGRYLVVTDRNWARVYDASNGQRIGELQWTPAAAWRWRWIVECCVFLWTLGGIACSFRVRNPAFGTAMIVVTACIFAFLYYSLHRSWRRSWDPGALGRELPGHIVYFATITYIYLRSKKVLRWFATSIALWAIMDLILRIGFDYFDIEVAPDQDVFLASCLVTITSLAVMRLFAHLFLRVTTRLQRPWRLQFGSFDLLWLVTATALVVARLRNDTFSWPLVWLPTMACGMALAIAFIMLRVRNTLARVVCFGVIQFAGCAIAYRDYGKFEALTFWTIFAFTAMIVSEYWRRRGFQDAFQRDPIVET